MQTHPAFARLNENLEQICTKVQQLTQCSQTNQQCTTQQEINEAVNVQMAQRLSQVVRSCQQELAVAATIMPQVALLPPAIRLHANFERLQATCRHLEQQQGANHQTTQQKQQQEASCAQLGQRVEQTIRSCQQDISQFVPSQTTPQPQMMVQPWQQQQHQQQQQAYLQAPLPPQAYAPAYTQQQFASPR